MRLLLREFLVSEKRRITVYSDSCIYPGQRGFVVLKEQRRNKQSPWKKLTGPVGYTDKEKAIEDGERVRDFYEASAELWTLSLAAGVK